jgi:hypothetical protein
MIWTLHAHNTHIEGVRFDGTDIVTRSSWGEISRWKLAIQAELQDSLKLYDRYIHCLPLRSDEPIVTPVGQQAACDISVEGAR